MCFLKRNNGRKALIMVLNKINTLFKTLFYYFTCRGRVSIIYTGENAVFCRSNQSLTIKSLMFFMQSFLFLFYLNVNDSFHFKSRTYLLV